MFKYFTIILILITIGFGFAADVSLVKAENGNAATGLQQAGSKLGTVGERAGTKELSDPERLVGRIINAVLGFMGVIFLGLTVYGGMMWMTAGGKTEQVEKARHIIIRAVVGIIIVSLAAAITFFISEVILPSFKSSTSF